MPPRRRHKNYGETDSIVKDTEYLKKLSEHPIEILERLLAVACGEYVTKDVWFSLERSDTVDAEDQEKVRDIVSTLLNKHMHRYMDVGMNSDAYVTIVDFMREQLSIIVHMAKESRPEPEVFEDPVPGNPEPPKETQEELGLRARQALRHHIGSRRQNPKGWKTRRP